MKQARRTASAVLQGVFPQRFGDLFGHRARYLSLHGANALTLSAGLKAEETEPFREAFLRGETASLPISDQMVDTLVVAGDPAHCRRRIQEYRDAGVDMPIVFEAMNACSPEASLEMIESYLMD